MKYNLSKLMKKAWSLFRQAARKAAVTFGEALRRAWAWLKVQEANKAIVEAAANALGIEEEYHTCGTASPILTRLMAGRITPPSPVASAWVKSCTCMAGCGTDTSMPLWTPASTRPGG